MMELKFSSLHWIEQLCVRALGLQVCVITGRVGASDRCLWRAHSRGWWLPRRRGPGPWGIDDAVTKDKRTCYTIQHKQWVWVRVLILEGHLPETRLGRGGGGDEGEGGVGSLFANQLRPGWWAAHQVKRGGDCRWGRGPSERLAG